MVILTTILATFCIGCMLFAISNFVSGSKLRVICDKLFVMSTFADGTILDFCPI